MQTALDVYADTVRPDAPLCIRIEAVTGGGDFALDLDNITFDPLASIHVQYTGTDTLTLTNLNGSDASIISTPEGGTVEVVKNVDIDVSCLDASDSSAIESARVYLAAAAGGPLTVGTEVMSVLTNASGLATQTFSFTSDQPVSGRTRKSSSSTYYRTTPISGTITENGLDLTALMVSDE
jgi:hypothetical protein